MWNDEPKTGDPTPIESKLDLQSADEVALWTYMLATYSATFRGEPEAWAHRRDFAIKQADDCVLAYRARMEHLGTGTPSFSQHCGYEEPQRKAS